jgi:CrcB protein
VLKHILCIAVGASIGATIRWMLSVAFNAAVPLIPMGTLLANLAGGYLMGVMLGAVAFFPQLSLEMKLFIVTGFLGSLTTFSAFSGEVVLLVQQRHFFAVFAMIALHVAGSLLMTGHGLSSFAFGLRFFK